MPNDTCVFCADIGTEARDKFGWCGVRHDGPTKHGSKTDAKIVRVIHGK